MTVNFTDIQIHQAAPAHSQDALGLELSQLRAGSILAVDSILLSLVRAGLADTRIGASGLLDTVVCCLSAAKAGLSYQLVLRTPDRIEVTRFNRVRVWLELAIVGDCFGIGIGQIEGCGVLASAPALESIEITIVNPSKKMTSPTPTIVQVLTKPLWQSLTFQGIAILMFTCTLYPQIAKPVENILVEAYPDREVRIVNGLTILGAVLGTVGTTLALKGRIDAGGVSTPRGFYGPDPGAVRMVVKDEVPEPMAGD